ncbi:MAG: hypothetical protein ACQESH_00875 [Campylobacterota bacterium]
MTTISLSTDIHVFFIFMIALTSIAHILVLNFKNPYKVRRFTRYLLPVFHIFIASNAFTGFILAAMGHLPLYEPRYMLMIIATLVLMGMHIAIKKALRWGNPKKDDIFLAFKARVTKICTYELIVLISATLVLFYLI